MLDHLINENDLWSVFKKNKLNEKDVTFIKEMIKPSKPVTGSWTCKGREKEKSFLYEVRAL